MVLVKRAHYWHAKIFYLDIGDYLTCEEKLAEIKRVGTVLNDFEEIYPNGRCDWVNQRGNDFETFISLHGMKITKYGNLFMTISNELRGICRRRRFSGKKIPPL